MTERHSSIVRAAAAVSGPDRERLLAEACGSDIALRREVDLLLAKASAADRAFDVAALHRAGNLLGADESLIGRRLGVYEIRAAIGAGGMGEVYRAHDTRLKRDVAIKVLPAEWAGDADRRARFQREAELLATLNHPNIAAIYGVEDADGISALVLELVDGPTLAARIARGPMPVSEALAIARQIADALDNAHQHGVVHRDLKPANIKVRPDGTVKVLDLGLAKAVAVDGTDAVDAPTMTGETRTGVVLGTPAYMSPEQARGQVLDKRTDIWSFGCVLYEMLTGRAPFAGKTTADTIAGILERSPDWDALPAATPHRVRHLLLRTIEKDPARRLRDIGEAKVAIDEARGADDGVAAWRSQKLRSWPAIAVAAVLLLALAGGGVQLLRTGFAGGTMSGRIGSLAVLPFVNINGGPDMEYQSDGITEGIIERLGGLPDLKVISHSAVVAYKGPSDDFRAVGRDLGVEAVLTGRIQSRNESLIVTLELVDARDNRHIESFRYDSKLSDLPALQREIPVDVSDKLRLRLSDQTRQRLTQQSTASAEAYQLYLKGRYFYQRFNPEDAQTAVNYFRQAIEKDPNYALAYAGLADAVVKTKLPPQEAHRSARDAAAKALVLDPALGEAHLSLAIILRDQDWDFEAAGQEYRRAIDFSPSSIDARHSYSHYLLAVGRLDESLVESEKLVDLDPVTPLGRNHLSYHYLYARQYDKVIEHARNLPASLLQLGDAYYAKGMFGEAVDQYLKERALKECTPEEMAPLRDAFARDNIEGYLRKRIEQAVAGQGRLRVGSDFEGAATMFDVARTYARLGEKDRVFEWLEKAYAVHSDDLVRLRQEIDFDPVRADPRFANLLRRIGLPPI